MAIQHCHFPITIHVTGRLDDDTIAQLAAGVEKAVVERIFFAEAELRRRQGVPPGLGPTRRDEHRDVALRPAAAEEFGTGVIHLVGYGQHARAARRSPIAVRARNRLTSSVPRRTTGPGSTADPIVLIEVSASSGVAVLTTRSGAQFDGQVTGLKLDPGSYSLRPNYWARTWTIFTSKGGLRFSLEIIDPDKSAEDPPGTIEPFSLTYEDLSLRVTPAATAQAQEAKVDLDEIMATIVGVLAQSWVGGDDEELVIRKIESVPASQAAEFLRRLEQPGFTWLEELDDRINGENNQRFHEALSILRLRAAPAKSLTALLAAPILPWHDVMGFFEDVAVFSADRTANGKIRVKYLGGTRIIRSTEFGDEIKNLPIDIFIGGVSYDADQPLVIHDYDSGRYVTVVAGELAGYQNLAIRNFLGHVATVATFAIPLSSATTVAGKIAVVGLERVLPAVFLLVDENRLNLVKWFPKWGPQMIRYSDTLKSFAAAVGFARLAVSGFQIFQQWRQVSRSRAALEGFARLDGEAGQVAGALEKEAEDAYKMAENVRSAETGPVVEPAPPVGKPAPPATRSIGTQPAARPDVSSAAAHALDDINEETRTFLGSNPRVRQALETSPLAAEALKACGSVCYPRFVTASQINRLEDALEQAEDLNIAVNVRDVQRAVKAAGSPAELDAVIARFEAELKPKIQVGQEFEWASEVAGEAKALEVGAIDEGFHLTGRLRDASGKAHGGQRLAPRSRLLDEKFGHGPIPGQIAAKLRAVGEFTDFRNFRETFWQLVANDRGLSQGWSARNLERMRQGLPPFVGKILGVSQRTGGGANAVLQLNHIRALKNAGAVFDLDNIEIVTPLIHRAIGD